MAGLEKPEGRTGNAEEAGGYTSGSEGTAAYESAKSNEAEYCMPVCQTRGIALTVSAKRHHAKTTAVPPQPHTITTVVAPKARQPRRCSQAQDSDMQMDTVTASAPTVEEPQV